MKMVISIILAFTVVFGALFLADRSLKGNFDASKSRIQEKVQGTIKFGFSKPTEPPAAVAQPRPGGTPPGRGDRVVELRPQYVPVAADSLVAKMIDEDRKTRPIGQLRLTLLEPVNEPPLHANSRAAPEKVGDLYKCAVGGKTTYQQIPCAEGEGNALKVTDSKIGRAVTPVELLRATMEEKGWTNGRRYENGRLVAEVKDGGIVVSPHQLANAQGDPLQQAKFRCRVIEEELERIKALQRQPLSGYEHDRIRRIKEELDAEHFSRKCNIIKNQ